LGGGEERKHYLLTLRRSLALGRSLGSLFKQVARKSLNSFDHAPGFFKVGGGSFGMMKITLAKWVLNLGGSFSAISIAVMPNECCVSESVVVKG